ncbi:MAG: FGGY-family carbohydrate kinase, partial [Alphaproteobacteria bacterium]
TIRELMTISQVKPSDIKAIGVSAVMMGVWPLGKDGKLVRNPILWNDARAQNEIDNLQKENPYLFEDLFAYSGSIMQTGCTLPVLLWLKNHEPENLEKTQYIFCAKDYIRFRLTGQINTEISEAVIAPGNAQTGKFEPAVFELLDIIGLEDKFLEPKASTELAGGLTADASKSLGLMANTAVAIGAGDVVSCVIGAGGGKTGHATTILGTTLMCGVTRDIPNFSPANLGLTFRLPENKWFRTMVNISGTTVLDWCLHTLTPDLLTCAQPYDALSQMAQKSPLGANGARFVPYLSDIGIIFPRIEPKARAQFYGLSTSTSREDLVRAIYEGIAFAIRENYETLNIQANTIHLVGGGAKSQFWAQMIADITQKETVILEGSQFGAKGAAICAMIATNHFQSLQDLDDRYFLSMHRFQPNTLLASNYERAFQDFKQHGVTYLNSIINTQNGLN